MLKTLSLAAAALTMTAGAIVPTAPAAAQRYYGNGYYDRGGYDYGRGGYDYGRGYNDGRVYRGDRGYYRDRAPRRCNSGTTGTIVGAIAGGLLGRTIDTRGDRTLGTVLGAGAGALAGRAVERSDRPGYCRSRPVGRIPSRFPAWRIGVEGVGSREPALFACRGRLGGSAATAKPPP